MTWIKWIGLVAVLLVVLLVVLASCGSVRWNSLGRELTQRLEAARVPARVAHYDARELDGLPPPVQRYFRSVLVDGAPVVAGATMEHNGTFNVSESGEQWKLFTSTQHVVTRPPGFVWNARIAMLPGLAVHVHDAYIAGEGVLHAASLGLFTLVDLRGPGELAQGELMRYVAEAPWYPTALLPSQGVRWEAVDEHSATATLADGPVTMSLLFRFDEMGLIESVRTQTRGRMVAGRLIATPWEGHWSNYQERSGMRVPSSGEVAWILPEGRKTYWRSTITSLTHEFTQ